MTITLKPNIVIKKPDGTNSPLFDNKQIDEESIDVSVNVSEWRPANRWTSVRLLLVLLMSAAMMAGLSILSGTMLYRTISNNRSMRHYRGYCAVPIDTSENFDELQAFMEPNYRVMSLQWHSEPELSMSLVTTEDEPEAAGDVLREQLQIDDDVEEISVVNDGVTVKFIHDFAYNNTGIVSGRRCFVWGLQRALVLAPDALLAAVRASASAAAWDVSPVAESRRAAIPPSMPPAMPPSAPSDPLHRLCRGKPLYQLLTVDEPIVRKRSVDAPRYDYIHFSGKHIQLLEITNLAEVLEYEKNHI